MKEQWKDIAGYKGDYQVSSSGNVRSWKYNMPEPLAVRNIRGYHSVLLYKSGKPLNKYVHRLVLEAFMPNLENKPQVNHKNGNKQDNILSNLEWVTRSENSLHAHRNGLMNLPRGEEHFVTKLTEEQVKVIKWARQGYDLKYWQLARMFGVSLATIGNIITGKTWRHVVDY